MKTYKNLYSKLFNDELIIKAISEGTHGRKKWKRNDVKKAFSDLNKFIDQIKHDLLNYHNKPHTPKEIYDGISRKKRTIIAPCYEEQIIHHMIVMILKPMMWKGMYDHAYGSIPNRGPHLAKKHIQKWIRKDSENCKYFLKIDIKKYFESIDHDILKAKFRKHIKDDRMLNLIFSIIDTTEQGLPLGFFTSQWFAMWYLQDFDHFIKEQLHAKHYVRYMDDIVIFGSSKQELKYIKQAIENELEKNYKLKLNNRTQLDKFSSAGSGRDIDFMGFRFYFNKTTLRKSILYKMCKKAKKINMYKRRPTLYELRQILSYSSWLNQCNIYNVWVNKIEPYINIHKARKRVSWFDKTHKITRSVWEEFKDVVCCTM